MTSEASESRMIVKYGAGIICTRYNPIKEAKEVLLIAKTHSPYYINTITGNYKSRLNLNKISKHEWILIKRYSILELHCRYFNISPEEYKTNILLQKHVNCINNRYIKMKNEGKIIYPHTFNNELYWEIPKGHKENVDKTLIDTACREFKEETTLDPGIIENDTYIINENSTSRKKYIVNYYLCVRKYSQNEDFIKVNSWDNILCGKWFTLKELDFISMDNKIKGKLNGIF